MTKQYGPYQVQKYSVITVPKEVRKKLGIKEGNLVVWVIDDQGNCVLKKCQMTI